MPVLESSIQQSVVRYARSKGAIAIKLTAMGRMGTAGWPDYMFIFHGKIMFMEFKAPGKTTTMLQGARQDELIAHGFAPMTVDSVELGIRSLDRFFRWQAVG